MLGPLSQSLKNSLTSSSVAAQGKPCTNTLMDSTAECLFLLPLLSSASSAFRFFDSGFDWGSGLSSSSSKEESEDKDDEESFLAAAFFVGFVSSSESELSPLLLLLLSSFFVFFVAIGAALGLDFSSSSDESEEDDDDDSSFLIHKTVKDKDLRGFCVTHD